MKKSAVIVSTILICHSLTAVAGRDWEDLSDFARYDIVSNLICHHSEDFIGLIQCRADELYHMNEWTPEEFDGPFTVLVSNGGRRFRVVRGMSSPSPAPTYGYVFGAETRKVRRVKLEGCKREYRPEVLYSVVTYFVVMKKVKRADEIIEVPSVAANAAMAVEKGVAYKLVPGCCFEVEAKPYQIRMEGWPDIEKKRVENIISSHERMVSMGRKGSYVALVRLSKRELSEAIYCLFGKRRYNELLSGGSNPYLIEIAGGIPETQFARDIYSAMKARRTRKGKK